MRKAAKIIGIIEGVIIVIVIISVLASPGEEETKPFSEQDVTPQTVQAALDDVSGTSVELGDCITDIEVLSNAGTDNPNDFIVHVYFKPESIWDEEDAVQTAVQSSIKAMEILFQNESISEVAMWEQLEFTDEYGDTETETAVRITMIDTVADQVVSWETVSDRAWSDYTSFFDLADLEYMHPAIAKEL